MLDKILRVATLFDFYGGLLTERQRFCLEMHYLNDLSLAEIAEELNVSRQAVHDTLRRTEQILQEYECKLGLVARYHQEQHSLQQVFHLLNRLPASVRQLPEVNLALQELHSLVDCTEEV